jgi:hypothetical protein
VAGEPGIGKTRLLMERLIEIVDLAPGEYAYRCELFGHAPTMKGMLVVQ